MSVERLSINTTVPKQTQQRQFGEVLKNTLEKGAQVVSNALLSAGLGSPIVSAAVSSVGKLAQAGGASAAGGGIATSTGAATGITTVGGTSGGTPTGGLSPDMTNVSDVGGMMSQMRAEADRSMAMQMSMQQESRDYNTLSNVLKTRHDSAKAAINNVR